MVFVLGKTERDLTETYVVAPFVGVEDVEGGCL